jgi:hypothetical protein
MASKGRRGLVREAAARRAWAARSGEAGAARQAGASQPGEVDAAQLKTEARPRAEATTAPRRVVLSSGQAASSDRGFFNPWPYKPRPVPWRARGCRDGDL